MVVFVHISLTPVLSKVECDFVATGFNNTVGNKGGVGISFKIGETRILCISCHLSHG
jgi:hypothetical protein